MFLLTIVIMIVATIVLRTLPPHVVWPLWTGLGIAAPLIVSVVRGHAITPMQWAAVALILIASCMVCYEDVSAGLKELSE